MQLLIFYEVWKYEYTKAPYYLPLFSFGCCFHTKISPSYLCLEYGLNTVKHPIVTNILFNGIFSNQSPFVFSLVFHLFQQKFMDHFTYHFLPSFLFFFLSTYQSLFPVKSQQGFVCTSFPGLYSLQCLHLNVDFNFTLGREVRSFLLQH